MAEIPCNIIKDLLPLYAEELTNEESTKLIKEHLSTCENCQKHLEALKSELDTDPSPSPQEADAIDFMKKSNKNRKHWIWFGVITALVLCVCLAFVRHLFVAHLVSAEQVTIHQLQVNEGKIHLDGSLRDSSQGVSSLHFTVSDGTLVIDMTSRLKNPFANNSFSADYNTTEPIERILLDDMVLWENGVEIPFFVAKVFAAKHDYLGNMSENGKSIGALDMPRNLGPYKSALQTDQEPYGWTIYLEEDMSTRNRNSLEQMLHYYSAMLIATIQNLDSIHFVYPADGTTYEVVYTEADADLHYGSSVKEAAITATGLLHLMNEW